MRNWTSSGKGKRIELFHQIAKKIRNFFESGRNRDFRKLRDFIAS